MENINVEADNITSICHMLGVPSLVEAGHLANNRQDCTTYL